MASFSEKIHSAFPCMTKSGRTVGTYYLENIDKVPFETLENLARKINVSTTTVIRFAHSMGYGSFSEMQKVLQGELLDKVGLPERLAELQESGSTRNQLMVRTMQNDIDNITKTFSEIDAGRLDQVVEMVSTAEHVYILGLRSSFSLAHYMTSRIGQIRPDVHIVESGGMLFPEALSGCGKKDVVLAFLFPRYSKTTSNLLLWLRKKGAPVILMTSAPDNGRLADFGDIMLPCYVSSVSFKNSFAAPVAVINYLAAALAVRDHDRAAETIRNTEEFLNMGYYLGL